MSKENNFGCCAISVEEFIRRGMGAQKAVDAEIAKATCSLEQANCTEGQAAAESDGRVSRFESEKLSDAEFELLQRNVDKLDERQYEMLQRERRVRFERFRRERGL